MSKFMDWIDSQFEIVAVGLLCSFAVLAVSLVWFKDFTAQAVGLVTLFGGAAIKSTTTNGNGKTNGNGGA
jgi:hypothetical protein